MSVSCVACRPRAVALADVLRSALLCAALGALRAQPFPCPPACTCVSRDAARCSGINVARVAELGLPVNLTHILLFGMGRGPLQKHSFRGMTVLQRLMLSDSRISAVAPGTFDDLIKLKTLRLSRNGITHLPGALLDTVVLLEQLFLDGNELTDIDPNLFRKLVNLRELFLNQNQLAFLPARLFANLGSLKVLDLSGNNLTHLPQGLLGTPAKLEKLVLHSNRLVSLDSGLLSSLRALKELQLDRNHIRSIAPGAFDRLGSLSSLTLSRNHLASLPPALFLYTHNVTLLTLFENPLEELPEVLFGELAGLRELVCGCSAPSALTGWVVLCIYFGKAELFPFFPSTSRFQTVSTVSCLVALFSEAASLRQAERYRAQRLSSRSSAIGTEATGVPSSGPEGPQEEGAAAGVCGRRGSPPGGPNAWEEGPWIPSPQPLSGPPAWFCVSSCFARG
ncbi:platelet glycoprotein V [Crocuta crocuta]